MEQRIGKFVVNWSNSVPGTGTVGDDLTARKFSHPQLRPDRMTARGPKGLSMAYDEDHAQLMRDALRELTGITEKKMFGGLCFMLNGNMLCGVHKDGGMARVGKDNEATALELDGIDPLSFTGRKMGGLVDVNADAMEDPDTRRAVLDLAIDFVSSLFSIIELTRKLARLLSRFLTSQKPNQCDHLKV